MFNYQIGKDGKKNRAESRTVVRPMRHLLGRREEPHWSGTGAVIRASERRDLHTSLPLVGIYVWNNCSWC